MTGSSLSLPAYPLVAPEAGGRMEALWRKLSYDLYFLDAAIESGDITGDQYAFLNGFCPDLVSEPLIEPDPMVAPLAETLARLDEAFLRWRATLPVEHRMALSEMALDTIRYRLEEELDEAAGCIAHQLVGEGLTPAAIDQALVVSAAEKGLHLALRSSQAASRHLGRTVCLIAEDLALPGARGLSREEIRAARSDIETISRSRRDQMDQFLRDLLPSLPERREGEQSAIIAKAPDRIQRRARKQSRKTVAKAVGLVKALLGRNAATVFVRGDELVLEGRRFNFNVRRKSLFAVGHGGLAISVTDKDHILLVDLCFYFDKTPAPDQLAALALHVKAGAEDEILKAANVIRYHPGAQGNIALRDVRGDRDQRRSMAWTEGGREFKERLEPFRPIVLPMLCASVVDAALLRHDETVASFVRATLFAPISAPDRRAA